MREATNIWAHLFVDSKSRCCDMSNVRSVYCSVDLTTSGMLNIRKVLCRAKRGKLL